MSDELDVIAKTYDLCLWFLPHIAKMPRSHKFTLGDRIEAHLLDLLERLIEAKWRKQKRRLLAGCNLRVDVLRFLIRFAKDLNLMPLSRYEYAAKRLDEIGRQIGGWMKQQAEVA